MSGLYNELKYIIWCIECERNPNYLESGKIYKNFLNITSKKHDGDCTLKAHTCQRCLLNNIEILATNACIYLNRSVMLAEQSKDGQFKQG